MLLAARECLPWKERCRDAVEAERFLNRGSAAKKAPLCKGRWHGEAVTEGL
jgi:hypothetical protein